ncbi:MAG: RNA polymerase sporulation sigma factor SigG [Eubacteriales bacterium]
MYCGKVEISGINTAKLKVLSDEEKEELLRKTKAGDARAREELICGNLRLVLSIIQRFGGRKESPDDLFQVGCIGLIKAVDNFNIDLGLKFSTYAVPMIIGEIRRYLRDNNAIRISRSTRDLAYRALSAREDIAREKQIEPTPDEIAQRLGESREAVVRAMEAIVEPISLYEPVFTENGDSLYVIDQLADVGASDEAWLENIALAEALETLGERERKIIDMRFYKNKTQMEIAEEIGISQAQVSRLEKGALERMRRQIT